MHRAVRNRAIWLAVAGVVASASLMMVMPDVATAAPGGGSFHGGGGAFHGAGGGFHGVGGFHAGGGGFHPAMGFHGGSFHPSGGFHGGAVRSFAVPGGGGRGYSFRSHAPHGYAGGHAAYGPHVRPGMSPGTFSAHRTLSSHMTSRNAGAVGHALSPRQIRTALHTHGGLHNPMTRAAITASVAGAAWNHHHGGFWWRHRHGGFGWVGPVFWPYAYYDLYDYAWWGWDYDPFFWDYGYPDLYAGMFGVYDYGALGGYAGYLPGHARPAARAGAPSASEAETGLADMCGSDSRDIAGLPVDRFRDAIQPNDEQSAALDELASASQKAAETIRNSCPADAALTAPGRLAAMERRLAAMHDAVAMVQPALERFYAVLTDEQKAKITALASRQAAPREALPSEGSCSAAQAGGTDWPAAAIERNVKPTDTQQAKLTALQDAAARAADILKSSCPPADARTPPARLAAVAMRLETMLQAVRTVRPALDDFYNSLSDEQKAAFDAIGPDRNGAVTASSDEGETSRRPHRHRHHGFSINGLIFRLMRL